MKKLCKYCGEEKEHIEFRIANIVKGKEYRRLKCNTCINNMKAKRREELRDYVWSIKEQEECNICGESRPATLDFHHRDPKEKDINIPNAVGSGWSMKRLEEEIEKCDILCANCHRILHWEKRNE